MVYFTNTTSSENEGHGILFAGKSNTKNLITTESDASEAYLDYDIT